ncbi:MAG: NADPH-dependent oxidoreductase [Cyanobacteriota bacterium]|nr:NADPH-dependent oxidoreductase [Cyanobacteriota bacterium]
MIASLERWTNLFQNRYGTAGSDPDPLSVSWNESLSTLLTHRSIRTYRLDPLPTGTLELLMAAAQSAATSSNLQTWSVVAVEDASKKARLADLARGQAHIRQCPLFLVWLADLARLSQLGDQRDLPYEALDYLEMFVMAVVDAALAAQNAVIAAESLGLGSVYIGALRDQPEAVAAELALPTKVFPVFGLCIGYPDPDSLPAIKPRLPQGVVLHRETYQLEPQQQLVDQYNQIMNDFYTTQQMEIPGDWTEHSLKRVAGSESLSGRHRLREALSNLGFKLQ